jgi:hypothetical protein
MPFDRKILGRLATLSQVGFEMVVPIGVGYLIDWLLGWVPILTIAGAIAGLVFGMAHLFLLLRQAEKDDRGSPED